MDYTGTGNSLNMRHPHVLQLLMDSLRYWVARDARRRLPLRPRGDAGARAARSRSAVGVLRSDSAGSRRQPGQADRRAVGRRRGRLSGRQLPAAVVRVERQVSRLGARLLARRRPDARRVRQSPDRQSRSLRLERPPAVRQRQLRHRPRRLHAARSRLVQREAQRGQRRGATATARTTIARGTTASKGRPTIRPINALRARQQRNFLATLLLSQGVPMLLAGDEIGRTQHGNNNAYCQDNEAVVDRLGARRSGPAVLHACRCWRFAARIRCSAAAAGSRGGRCTASDVRDIAWFTPPGTEMSERGLVGRLRQVADGLPQRRAIPSRGPRGEPIVDDTFLLCFNAHYEAAAVHDARRVVRHALAPRHRHGRSRSAPADRRPLASAAGASRSRIGPWSFCSSTSRHRRWHRRLARGMQLAALDERRLDWERAHDDSHPRSIRPLPFHAGSALRRRGASRRAASGRPTFRSCIRTAARALRLRESRTATTASADDDRRSRSAGILSVAVRHRRVVDADDGPSWPAARSSRRWSARRQPAGDRCAGSGIPERRDRVVRGPAAAGRTAALGAVRRRRVGRPGAPHPARRRARSTSATAIRRRLRRELR